jgi:predicted DNA-binding ribbon-helix-helix protein
MTAETLVVERVQTGVRMEKRLLKVLKAFAELHDMTLGDLLEGIVLHAFDGKCPFQTASLLRIKELKRFYGMKLDSRASHRMTDKHSESSSKKRSSLGRGKAPSKNNRTREGHDED